MSDPHKKNQTRGPGRPRHTRFPLLFPFFFFRFRLSGAGLRLLLGFGFFHRLLGFFGFFGAGFGALLALFVEDLLAAEQLDESLIGAIALLPSAANDAGVASFAIAETRAKCVK